MTIQVIGLGTPDEIWLHGSTWLEAARWPPGRWIQYHSHVRAEGRASILNPSEYANVLWWLKLRGLKNSWFLNQSAVSFTWTMHQAMEETRPDPGGWGWRWATASAQEPKGSYKAAPTQSSGEWRGLGSDYFYVVGRSQCVHHGWTPPAGQMGFMVTLRVLDPQPRRQEDPWEHATCPFLPTHTFPSQEALEGDNVCPDPVLTCNSDIVTASGQLRIRTARC